MRPWFTKPGSCAQREELICEKSALVPPKLKLPSTPTSENTKLKLNFVPFFSIIEERQTFARCWTLQSLKVPPKPYSAGIGRQRSS